MNFYRSCQVQYPLGDSPHLLRKALEIDVAFAINLTQRRSTGVGTFIKRHFLFLKMCISPSSKKGALAFGVKYSIRIQIFRLRGDLFYSWQILKQHTF